MPRKPLARSPLPQVEARYDAAGQGRRAASWRAPATGPVRVLDGSAPMRHRARDSVRNDWASRSLREKWGSTLIGVGIQPRFKRVPEGKRRSYIVDLWADWVAQADADGALNFYGLQTLAVKSWFESGEVFVRIRPRSTDAPLPVPFQVQLLEADFVPYFDAVAWPGMPEGNTIRQGIERNKWGRRVAYWMFKEHPGDYKGTGSISPQDLVRVPASMICHMYEPDRPGALRGVSQLSAVLMRARNAADLEDNVLDRQKLANLFVAWITKQIPDVLLDDLVLDPNTGLPKAWDVSGRAVATMEPGITQELAPGESVTFANPPEAGISHADYLRTVNMGTASGGNMPYEVMSGDIRGVSDRTLRVVILEFRRFAQQRQWQMVIPQVCQKVVDAFATYAALGGKIRASEVDAVRRVEWSPHGWEHIHPVQDPQGRILEIQAGLRSRDSGIAERGDDPATVDQERKDSQDREARLGIKTMTPTGLPGLGKQLEPA